jgi:hypothetical protein
MSAERSEDPLSQKSLSESLENQGVQEAEIEEGGKGRTLAFEPVNEVTHKVTDGRGSIAWSGDRGGGRRTTRAVTWLIGVGDGLWVARYRNKVSRPMKVTACKRYVLEMIRGIRPGIIVSDPIKQLLSLQIPKRKANASWLKGINRPVVTVVHASMDLVAYVVRVECGLPERTEDREAQPLQGDDYPIELESEGYAILPDCLKR